VEAEAVQEGGAARDELPHEPRDVRELPHRVADGHRRVRAPLQRLHSVVAPRDRAQAEQRLLHVER
jgi:hypothetical protein